MGMGSKVNPANTDMAKKDGPLGAKEGIKAMDTISSGKRMRRRYQINGISCGSCVSKVKKVLESHPEIGKTEIFLAPKGATIITMKRKLSIEDIQKQLNELEGYTITKIIQDNN